MASNLLLYHYGRASVGYCAGPPDEPQDDKRTKKAINSGLWLAATFGATGALLMALSAPFVLPAFRRHCLPYLPASSPQLENLSKAIRRYAKKEQSFIDIGSGDGRICRLVSQMNIFSQVHGVELNPVLVAYSRLKSGLLNPQAKFYHADLWHFPLKNYDAICVFGVDSMMKPLGEYLTKTNIKPQTIYVCRFPITDWKPIDEIGDGIDTVWVYSTKKDEQ